MIGSAPIGSIPIAARAGSYSAPAAESVLADKWFSQLSVPVRRVARATDFPALARNTIEIVTPDKWFSALSLGPRTPGRAPHLARQLADNPGVQADFISIVGWYADLSHPKRRLELPLAQRLPAMVGLGEPLVPFEWFTHISVPTRRMPRLVEGLQKEFSFTLPESVAVMRWFTAMALPTRLKDWRSSVTNRNVYAGPAVLSFGWWVAMNTPPRAEKVHAARQPKDSSGSSQPLLWPLIFIDWFAQLQIPTRERPTRNRVLQLNEPFSYGALLTVLPMDWLMEMSVPTRLKPQLHAIEQPAENTMYIRGNLPFAKTGPLFINARGGRGTAFWRGRST